MKWIKLQHALMIFFIYNGFLYRFFASFVEKAERKESLLRTINTRSVNNHRFGYISFLPLPLPLPIYLEISNTSILNEVFLIWCFVFLKWFKFDLAPNWNLYFWLNFLLKILSKFFLDVLVLQRHKQFCAIFAYFSFQKKFARFARSKRYQQEHC